jgi:hypothetical protein
MLSLFINHALKFEYQPSHLNLKWMLILQHTVCVHFIQSIQEALDRGVYALGIFFHLTKAYEFINHNILLAKLDVCYIRGVRNLWFISYLAHS